jgi:pyruvate dehydrogenase E2 component (dihydrolipoamide acetyltransferase)
MPERLEVHLPDIGDFHDVDVVELLVSVGQRVEKEQSLLVLESDKATMEIPSPAAGVIEELRVRVGDQLNEGDLVAVMLTDGAPLAREPMPASLPPTAEPVPPVAEPPRARRAQAEARPEAEPDEEQQPAERAPAARSPRAHAGPSVRRLARELGVDLARVPGTARKGRITREDVQKFVKASLSQGGAPGVPLAGVAVAAPLDIDFSKWGETELQPLNRVRRISSANLHRSWVTVPHVTQFDEADITELDAFRGTQKEEAKRRGVKLTFLPFVVKAVTAALHEFPHFNASLDRTGESLIVKKYFHVGVAVDTESGLVVPVIRDADRKGLFELAAELEDLSTRARSRRLRPAELQGGSFSISSLGGIGGTFFTPIVNHPEVAILGVSRMQWKPVWRDGAFVPRLILPLSLSYDHRVIDGADAVRFTRRLTELVGDLRLLLL